MIVVVLEKAVISEHARQPTLFQTLVSRHPLVALDDNYQATMAHFRVLVDVLDAITTAS